MMTDTLPKYEVRETDIAVIGMTGRFPGARNLDEFWRNLRDGVESISFFTDEELIASGMSQSLVSRPDFVKARGSIGEIDMFDADFFGLTPRDAEIMEPQHRFFLEHAWQALEDAGYDPEIYKGAIGVFAGASLSKYVLNLVSTSELAELTDWLQIKMGNERDHLTTRTSYLLNLRGPSVNVQTACSTSLVTVHMACQSLLSGECNMALAGGVCVNSRQKGGYIYFEGGYGSPDGHCRAFDASAQGIVNGDGIGIVVLKRLEDAINDGDFIRAVIRGSAINNDGYLKIGYMAPGVDGQSRVILEALAVAGVNPESISYVETHGTGTPVGDPIEFSALKQAFEATTQKRGFCAIGSLKTNIGHLDIAAGVAGLIKTVLSLEKKKIPPSLHYEKPNPEIDFINSPFFVNVKIRDWNGNSTPRRAGVSSFGLGGTNAHVILEEAPEIGPPAESRPQQLLALSARTPTALDVMTSNLANHLRARHEINLPDVAYTLQVGRKSHQFRRVAICSNVEDAIKRLETPNADDVFTHQTSSIDRPIVFMFPGGGAQYVKMAFDLYLTEPTFRECVDVCADLVRKESGIDLRDIIYPDEARVEYASRDLMRTPVMLPAVFTVEYALAMLLKEWGITPQAIIGHSLGEYTAALLSGVFSLEDAVSIVVARGRLIELLPAGVTLSVTASAEQLTPLLKDEMGLAAINGPSQCTVSGTKEGIAELEGLLRAKDIEVHRLEVDVAAHSAMMAPVCEAFAEVVGRVKMSAPVIPFISNVTGTWITDEEAIDPCYWVRHLRETVLFMKGINELSADRSRLFLEVGPGRALSSIVRKQLEEGKRREVFHTMRHRSDRQSDVAVLLGAVGRLWAMGAEVNWSGFYAGESRRRVPLPTYPFERKRYWVGEQSIKQTPSQTAASAVIRDDIKDWFYIPSWRRAMAPTMPQVEDEAPGRWLIFLDDLGIGDETVKLLESRNSNITTVTVGDEFKRMGNRAYMVNPENSEDYHALVRELTVSGDLPTHVMHFWTLRPADWETHEPALLETCKNLGYYSLLYFAQALEKERLRAHVTVGVISNNLFEIGNDEKIIPEKSLILGPCKVISQEFDSLSYHVIDVAIGPEADKREKLVRQLVAEVLSNSPARVIAYRGSHRWIQTYEPVVLEEKSNAVRPLKYCGTYLLVGGLGTVGFLLASYLARTLEAKLVLITRTEIPPRDQWREWLQNDDQSRAVARKIARIRALEDLGSEVIVIQADATDEGQMRSAIDKAYERFGGIDGVIYGAVDSQDRSLIGPFGSIGRAESEKQFQPKVNGLYVLDKVIQARKPDWCLLLSSNASVLGGDGLVSYSASNHFQDAYAAAHNKTCDVPWISSNWDGWLTGERKNRVIQTSLDLYAMAPSESTEAFKRIVTRVTASQVVVSSGDLQPRLTQFIDIERRPRAEEVTPGALISQDTTWTVAPDMPITDLEKAVAEIWRSQLGVAEIRLHDNFFELGGDSLTGIRVLARLRNTFQVNLPIHVVFESPTISNVAEAIAKLMMEEVEALSEEEAERLANPQL